MAKDGRDASSVILGDAVIDTVDRVGREWHEETSSFLEDTYDILMEIKDFLAALDHNIYALKQRSKEAVRCVPIGDQEHANGVPGRASAASQRRRGVLLQLSMLLRERPGLSGGVFWPQYKMGFVKSSSRIRTGRCTRLLCRLQTTKDRRSYLTRRGYFGFVSSRCRERRQGTFSALCSAVTHNFYLCPLDNGRFNFVGDVYDDGVIRRRVPENHSARVIVQARLTVLPGGLPTPTASLQSE